MHNNKKTPFYKISCNINKNKIRNPELGKNEG